VTSTGRLAPAARIAGANFWWKRLEQEQSVVVLPLPTTRERHSETDTVGDVFATIDLESFKASSLVWLANCVIPRSRN